MTLKINNWKKLTSRIFWGLLAALLLVFFLRIVIWEDQYYKGKEGSNRAVAVIQDKDEQLIEVVPTEQEITEYTVPEKNPRYLTIEALGRYKARVLAVGTKGANNELAAPNNIYDAGWYMKSGKPGEGKTLVVDGHRGGPNEPNGIFNNLETLAIGTIIKIERGDGETYEYKIVENETYPSDSADIMKKAMQSPELGKESLSIITCVGGWDLQNQTYNARQLVRAVLAD